MRHLKSPVVPWLRGNEGCSSARARLAKLGTLAWGCISLEYHPPGRDAFCFSVYSEMSLQIAQELYVPAGALQQTPRSPFKPAS